VRKYNGSWGNQKSMKNLWEIIGDNNKKRRCIGSIFSCHRQDINNLLISDLSNDLKRRVLVWMKLWYKKRIFEDTKCLTDYEKRHLYSAIMGTQREAYREIKKVEDRLA